MGERRPVVVVTGGSRGIGAAVARLAGARGYDVCLSYVARRSAAEAVVAELRAGGARALAVRADVARADEVAHLFAVAGAELGPPAALVNNAGVTGGLAPLAEVAAERFELAFRVSALGTLLCMQAAARAFHARGGGGAIVNVSSTGVRTTGAGEWVHYAAAKAAVDALTRGAARELGGDGIRVNAVAPGLILTDLHADNGVPERPERLRGTVPLGRIGRPEEVATAVLWLLSDEAAYVSGAVLEVGGGR